jgi:hypothetical protein
MSISHWGIFPGWWIPSETKDWTSEWSPLPWWSFDEHFDCILEDD